MKPSVNSRLVVYQIKDTIFWKQITTPHREMLCGIRCLSDQRYNFLKANHNGNFLILIKDVLFIRSKIQFFESKSQLLHHRNCKDGGCLSDQRYNFLKANHNRLLVYFLFFMLFSDQRYNFLKANHNTVKYILAKQTVVYQIKDTIFWKQITTQEVFPCSCLLLFIRSKIQFFESYSQ